MSKLFHENIAIRCLTEDKTEHKQSWKIGIEYGCNIFINNILYQSYTISPHDIEYFAYGYMITSGKINSLDDIASVEYDISSQTETVDVKIMLKEHVWEGFLCDKERNSSVKFFNDKNKVSYENLMKGARKFMEIAHVEKEMNYSLHMGGWFDNNGELVVRCYDLSRHVALDKTLGTALRKYESKSGFLIMSSRSAFELLHKAINGGINNIIFMSAPTTSAIKLAKAHDVNLMVLFKNKLYQF